MIKPLKPTKPCKPKLDEPKREVMDRYYLWYATKWDAETKTHRSGYEFTLGQELPMIIEEDGEAYPDGDYSEAEDAPLTYVLDFLKEHDIDPKCVTLDNEMFYRKNNGQLVLNVVRQLTDTEYNAWVLRNKTAMQRYQEDLDAYPDLMEAYHALKKEYDIQEAEKRLRELRA